MSAAATTAPKPAKGAKAGKGAAPAPEGPSREDIFKELRGLPLLDGLPSDLLAECVTKGDLDLKTFDRDDFVIDAMGGQKEAVTHIVRSGQVAVAMFDAKWLDAKLGEQRKAASAKKKNKKQDPVMRHAEKNVANFEENDVYNPQALAAVDAKRTAIYAVTPAKIMIWRQARIADICVAYPFFAQRLRRSVEAGSSRLGQIHGVKQEIFDFNIRHGLSVSETARVRQLDRCIDCYECERACNERYGHERLHLNGFRLGMLDFVATCRTCVDQRCIDPCNFDSIYFDTAKREIVIVEDKCTGCTLCATACPYNAIDMVDLDDPENENFRIVLDERGVLQFGAGTNRKARTKRMASKCDHCSNYEDQACISHCPTGALIEIKPTEIFQDRTEAQRLAASAGFDHTVMRPATVIPIKAFQQGLKITDGADSKLSGGRINPAIYWSIFLTAFLICAVEVALRLYLPRFSAQYWYNRTAHGWDHYLALTRVRYSPGVEFAVYLGYFGMGLIVATMGYPLRKRFRLLQRIPGSAQGWFDFHLMAGIVGPLFVSLHTAARFANTVAALAYLATVITVVSGLVGRYIYTYLPKGLNAYDVEALEHERVLAGLRAKNPGVAACELELLAYRNLVTNLVGQAGLLRALAFVMRDQLKRPGRWLLRRRLLKGVTQTRREAREILRRTGRLMLLERRRVLVPKAKVLLTVWKKIHVPLAIVLLSLATAHIVIAYSLSM
ncbi:MAG: 4Fe-4S dicluster domain-containing protein [Deltaproteobacteria bacterium]|nr:4Fe-4S dicluster domain-containing protein [Deltaproteobacteria bacterium]